VFGPFEVAGGTQRGPWEERSLGKGGAEGAPTRLFPGTTFVAKNHAWESYRLITCTSGTSRGGGTGGGKDGGERSKGSEFTMGSGKATYG